MYKFGFNVRTLGAGRLALRTTVVLAAAAALVRVGALPDALAQGRVFVTSSGAQHGLTDPSKD